jgi:hypothetical protein
MDIERTGDRDRGSLESAGSGVREPRDTFDGWLALSVRLVAFAITLCIVGGLLQALQSAIQHADSSVELVAHSGSGEEKDRLRDPIEEPTAPLIADNIRAEARMYATKEVNRWIGR